MKNGLYALQNNGERVVGAGTDLVCLPGLYLLLATNPYGTMGAARPVTHRNTHTHMHMHAPTHTHAHAHVHAHTHIHIHAHTRTHTHTNMDWAGGKAFINLFQ